MKFAALKTELVTLKGSAHGVPFIKGREYDMPEEAMAVLQEAGVAPDGKKSHNPVEHNKMAHPVESNKLTLGKKQ